MKTVLIVSVVLTLAIVGTTGCASDGSFSIDRQSVGLVAGGIAGGALGHVITDGNAVGTIGGAVGGALIGREIAKGTQ